MKKFIIRTPLYERVLVISLGGVSLLYGVNELRKIFYEDVFEVGQLAVIGFVFTCSIAFLLVSLRPYVLISEKEIIEQAVFSTVTIPIDKIDSYELQEWALLLKDKGRVFLNLYYRGEFVYKFKHPNIKKIVPRLEDLGICEVVHKKCIANH